MIDKSTSMSRRERKALLKSAKYIVANEGLNISSDETRVLIVQFGNVPDVKLNLNDCEDAACVLRTFRQRRFKKRSSHELSNIKTALREAKEIFTVNRGARECSRKVLLFLTDGLSYYEGTGGTVPSAEELRNFKTSTQAEIFVIQVAVGKVIRPNDEDFMPKLVSGPSNTHLFYAKNFRELNQTHSTCRALPLVLATSIMLGWRSSLALN